MKRTRFMVAVVAMGLMASVASATMLTNGGFESGTTGWSSTQGGFGVGDSIWSPGAPMEGTEKGHVQSGNANGNWLAYQTVAVTGGENLTLTGWYSWGAWAEAEHGVFVFDGGAPSGTILDKASAVHPTTGVAANSGGWVPFSLDFSVPGPTTQITVAFGWINGGGWSNGNATYADGLVLIPEPASLALLGLAGIPLLLRRRRA